MKCRNCINRYSAASNQPVHGGSSAPGGFFIAGLISAAVMVGLSSADVAVWKWLALGMAVFSAVQVCVAWGNCRGLAGEVPYSGERCPHCEHENTVWLWSL